MRVAVHHEPAGGLGGSEVTTAVLAATLRDRGDVVVLHHHPALTRDALARFAGVDLGGVEVRFVPPPARTWRACDGPAWRLSRELRRWQAELSAGYDLFASCTHGVPPFCHAARGVLYVHFPLFDRRGEWPWHPAAGVRGRVRRWWHERHWRARLASYAVRVANSRFTADWARTYWGGDWGVLHPPVDVGGPAGPKRDAVAVLGRFTPMKRQLELVRAFRSRAAPRLPGWELVCVGTVGASAEDREYFRAVEAAAAGGPVRLLTDVPPDGLKRELAAARVFWHGAGFGVDPRAEPHRLEHFGMATVEAMAAGCVPVVPNRGGQPEIVTPGCGFLCESVEEVADRTAELAADPRRAADLAAAARARAQAFSREAFARRVRELLGG